MLTNTRARAARPRSARYELTCEAQPGFILRVLPSGRKVFFIRFRDADGKDRRHRLGPMVPGFGVDEARRAAMAVLARRTAAVDVRPAEVDAPVRVDPPVRVDAPPGAASDLGRARPPASPPAGPRSPTLREFAARFEAEHIDMYLKPQTASHYRSSLRKHILPALGDRPLDEITTTDVQRLHNSMRATPSAANYARCVLSVLFSKAEQWEQVHRRNPVTVVGRFEERAVERFLDPEERQALERVLSAAASIPAGVRGHIGRDAIWAIRLLALTGMRRDEVRDLRWEQVDWRQSLLRLPDSKTSKRDVVVSDEVMRLLASIAAAKRQPRAGLVVCSSTGKKLHSLGETWRNVREQAGIPDVRLHDLRHSVASDAIMNGVPLEVVGKMLGHRNYHTTQRYAHIADTVLRDAVNLTSTTIVRAGRGEAAPARRAPAPRSRAPRP